MTSTRLLIRLNRPVRAGAALALVAVLSAGCGSGGGKTSDSSSAASSTAPTTATIEALTTTSSDATTTTATTAVAAPTTEPRVTTTTAKATPITAKSSVMAIDIKGFMFQPNPVHVPVGATVMWTNRDEILHTVTSGMRTYDDQHLQKDVIPGPPGFDFQLDGKGKTATFSFPQAGTFSYLCSRHPGMDAQIVVG